MKVKCNKRKPVRESKVEKTLQPCGRKAEHNGKSITRAVSYIHTKVTKQLITIKLHWLLFPVSDGGTAASSSQAPPSAPP